MAEHAKQLPVTDGFDRPFWEAARRHELVMYRCTNCGKYYDREVACPDCENPQMAWEKVGGRGEVFTYCIFRRLYHPAWEGDIPYNVAYVKLDEGPLLMTNIVDCSNDKIYIGMPVEVVFEDINEEVTLPKFRPVTA